MNEEKTVNQNETEVINEKVEEKKESETTNTEAKTTTQETSNTATTNTVPPMNQQPKIIYVEKPRKKLPWKSIIKYVLVFLVAGLCGFGGGLFANYVDRQQTSTTYENKNNESLPSFPDFNESNGNSSNDNNSNGNSSNGSSSQKQNTNKAALGVKVTEQDDGVYIAGFSSNSNAESAGLKIGDKITKIDGTEYSTYNDIVTYIGTKDVGDTVEVTVERDGEEKTISVELGERSSQNTLPGSSDSSVY